jgi:hypothetical protein
MNHSDYMKMPMDDLRAMCSARGLGKFTGQGAKMKMSGALVALDRQSGGAERVPYNKVSVPAPERPVDAVRGGDGMMSEADVLDALEAFRGQGLAVQVDSAAGSWTLRRGDQVDSGTLAMPRRDFIRCAKRMVI